MGTFNYEYPVNHTAANLIPVPYGVKVSVEIIRNDEGSAHVWVHAPIYMRKLWRMDHTYCSNDFSDYKILNDIYFVSKMLKRYPSE